MRSSQLLELEPRQRATVYQLRSKGMVPGILYGPSRNPEPVQLGIRALQAALKDGATHRPVAVRQPGTGAPVHVLVKDIQRDQFTGLPMHVDLLLVTMDHPVAAEVPIRVHGEEKLFQRHIVLQMQMHNVKMEALPKDLPDALVIDVSELRSGTVLTVGELAVPPNVKLLDDKHHAVLSAHHSRKGAEEPASV